MESEPHVPPSELYTDWEEEKPKLKDESGGVSNPEPQLFSHHSPAGSRPDGKKEDETEPAEPNSSGPVNWLAPVEDDEGPDEAPGKCRRRLAFEVARRSLSAMLDSDSNDKKGNEVLQQVPGTNIHSLRFKARAEHHLVKLKAVSPHQRNPKHFACEMCGKVFISRRDRERHNRMHSGEKPFSCPHCHRSFSDRANMCKHMLIHSGVKPYICPDCGKGFSEKGNLRRHRGMIHGSIPKAHCKDCPKSYVEKSGLDRHIRSGACPGR
ncbi:hypothetical protein DPEC_G00027550 [Dallia pectoralis]|uniref:Uncharacterized protein n=1 Tax=Dallia pectoralis TaxID=75939 RepID=A0ACC2HIM4_DALPE|nr:hypothetical protein DPEC_G00027550 [Dallia pectoralis]